MDYRFRLATYRECKAHREWNTTCPACGRKRKFVPYIDTHTMRPVDDRQCGRCNRESNCGYHLPPRVVASPNPLPKRGLADIAEPAPSLRERAGGEAAHYEKMHRACEQSQPWGSHFVTWLRTRFPREAVAAAIKRYRVGGTPDGATLWWQIDGQGRVHTGKGMKYNPLTGHRVKESSGAVNWAHRMRLYGEPSELVVGQCLFGEHLLSESTTDFTDYKMDGSSTQGENPRNPWSENNLREIGVVESEKTALIMSLVCPDKVWLATGGKANFKEQMLWPLLGHEVAVYPDADALTDWEQRIHRLNRELGHRLYIPTGYYNLMNHEVPRREGWDLADVIKKN